MERKSNAYASDKSFQSFFKQKMSNICRLLLLQWFSWSEKISNLKMSLWAGKMYYHFSEFIRNFIEKQFVAKKSKIRLFDNDNNHNLQPQFVLQSALTNHE